MRLGFSYKSICLYSAFILLLMSPFCIRAETLKQAIQYAIYFSPDVKYAIQRRYAANQGFMAARADYFPIVEGNADYGFEWSKNPTATAITGGPAQLLNRRDSGIFITEHIFTGFATKSEVRRNKAIVQSRAWKINGQANDVALDVTEQYLEVIKNRRIVAYAKQNIHKHKQILSMIRERTGAGIDRESDLRQAQGRLDLAEANYIAAKSKLLDAEVKFTRVVGRPPKALSPPPTPRHPSIPRRREQAVSLAVKDHPTLKSALADVQAAVQQHNSSLSKNYPSVDLTFQATRNRNLDGLPGPNNDDMGLVHVSYTFFKGGKDIADQRRTAYEIQEADEIKNRTILQVEETMRLSWNALITAQNRMSYLSGHLSSAKSTFAAYEEQFRVGKRSLLDLLDTQNEVFEAQIQYITAKYDELFARYRILNAMGKILPYLHVPLPIAANPNSQIVPGYKVNDITED